jgi:triosephosphate isomerase (TIM)
MRKPVMAGNWKMYKTPAETTVFFAGFIPLVAAARDREIVIAAPYIDLAAAVEAACGTNIEIGAQDVFWEKDGAFTGQVSAPMLKAVGAQWVLVGHSERRQYFGETDETVYKRTVAALSAGLKPIVCVGELLADREAGRTNDVLAAQFAGGLAPLTPEQFASVVVAYEPVWAIGTGKTATLQMASDAHAAIRELAASKFGKAAGDSLRILYGGSVKPENVRELMSQEQIDGVLVGGASLKAEGFASIVNY